MAYQGERKSKSDAPTHFAMIRNIFYSGDFKSKYGKNALFLKKLLNTGGSNPFDRLDIGP